MLIAYDNLFVLEPEEHGEQTRLAACAHSKVMLTLNTSDFRVDYDKGVASVSLARHLTHQQARDLANSILQRVELLEKQEKEWNVVMGTTVTSPGVVANVVKVGAEPGPKPGT